MRALDEYCTCARRTLRMLNRHHAHTRWTSCMNQMGTTRPQQYCALGHVHACIRPHPCAHLTHIRHMWGYGVGVYEGWGFLWNIIINYLNIPLCLLKGIWCLLQISWEWPVLLFKGMVGDLRGHQGQASIAPNEHNGTTLGVPRTHRRHSSTHTWAPWHVWCAPRGHNDTGLGAACLLPMLARGRLKTCVISRLKKPWTQCHSLMGH